MTISGRLVVIGLSALTACTGDNNTTSRDVLIDVETEPEGFNCEHGGVVITTGVDTDYSGELDPAEVTGTQYVCHGASELTCPDGDSVIGVVIVQSVADLAQLSTTMCIDGDLIVTGLDVDVTEALPLNMVTGTVTVAGNSGLTSLRVLDNLTEVGRSYSVQANSNLVDIATLSHLDRHGTIIIVGNDALADLQGLSPWTKLESHLVVSNNSQLMSLAGLENVLTTEHTITIQGNASLTSTSALAQLRSAGQLLINGNPQLVELGLTSLQKVDAAFQINANASLDTISLPSLTTASSITVQNAAPLTTFEAPSLLVLNSLYVFVAPSLTTLSLPELAFATGDIDLRGVSALATVDLHNLSSIGGYLQLNAAASLPSLTGFSALASVAGSVTVTACNNLTSLTGLGALTGISGSLSIQGNTQLTSLTGADALTHVDGNLTITGNAQLPSSMAATFASSVEVGGTVTIQ